MNEVYLFLLAITLGFGFALGGVLARLLERVVRFELRIRESRRRLLLKLDVDRELKKIEAGTAHEAAVAADASPYNHLEDFRQLAPAPAETANATDEMLAPVWFCGAKYVGRA